VFHPDSGIVSLGVAHTASDLTAVQAARRRCVRTVQFADRSTTYTSDAEMRQVESDIRRDLAEVNQRPRQFFGEAGKGLA
jgi:hypothetical protein